MSRAVRAFYYLGGRSGEGHALSVKVGAGRSTLADHLTMAMDKDGNIDLQPAQLVYKSWKAKGDWITERISVADLKAMISDVEVLYWEFFDITMGIAPRSKGSALARVLGQKQAAKSVK
ncbi:hypothetical protein [Ensifer sp. 4252]|uniref:hypothetical protein n=1 Tax=Ensifer sp. 4252 TaxID=3373915 RepID=UPI003D260F55